MSHARLSLSARLRAVLLATVVLSVIAGVVTPVAQAAPAGIPEAYRGKIVHGHHWEPDPKAASRVKQVAPRSTPLRTGRDALTLRRSGEPGRRTAPAADRGALPAAAVAGEWQSVGSTDWAAAAAVPVSSGAATATDRTALLVDVLSASVAKRYGQTGLVLRLRRPDAGTTSTPVAMRIPTETIDGIFGADYASRLRWVEYPDTGAAPSAAAPSASQPRTVATTTAGRYTVLTPQVTSQTMVLAAAAGTISSTGTGNFGATSLSPAGEWQVSAQTGSFSWSYPFRVPPAAAGPTPDVALSYDSGSIDGETGSTNNQPSAVGDGWQLSGAGFIERSYIPCSLDNGPSGPVTTSGDLCWKTDNATLSLAGHSSPLVRDSASGTWKLQNDDGSRLERLTGAVNGARNGEYWRLTTQDGIQYYFGLNHLPGWATGKPTTASTWTVPVYGNDTGEPCKGASFAVSACTQAWRWNLDYVVDPHNNATAYYYKAESNRYAQNGSATASTLYWRGGQLDHIDYGLTSTTVYATNGATDKVLFTYANRCVSATGCDSAHPTNWPDVPWDQNCTSTTTCPQKSPSFWTTLKLSTVKTQYWNAAGAAYATVDTWTLAHSYPNPGDGTTAALWLGSITHAGNAGTTAITLPKTSFTGATFQNRVWAVDGLAPLAKYRITSITTESGAVVSVNYSAQDCQPAEATAIEANANTNTRRCFPQWWTPQMTPPQPAKLDLFHKYVVTSVISDPRTGGAADQAQWTEYAYTGQPAWRYNTSPLTPDAQRTWSIFAGYSAVEIRVGDPAEPTSRQTTAYTFYQGMDGDRAATSGGTKTVTVHASDGSDVPDSLWLAGQTREVRTLNGVGGAVVSTTLNTPWASAVTANDGTRTARMVGDGVVRTTVPLAAGGTRATETRSSYDGYGRLTEAEEVTPDAGTRCTTTTYATNTSTWLIAYPAEVRTVAVPCGATPNFPADAISHTRNLYDGGALGSSPTKGDVTTTQVVDGYAGGAPEWLTTATLGYDGLGRVKSVTDPRAGLNRTTTTTYTPATGGPLTRTVVTNPLGWTTTTDFAPAWGAQTAVTDQNAHTTTATYDALGRRTAVWGPDRPQATNPTPSVGFAYTVVAGAPLAVATTRLTPIGTITDYALYDGLGRSRQSQSHAEGGVTAVSDGLYDAAGRAYQQNQPYVTTDVQPSGTLFVPTTTIAGQQLFTFDGVGRVLTEQQWLNGSEAWRTSHAYPGADRVDTTPPDGGTPSSTWTDSAGRTFKLVEYLADTPSAGATQEATTYSYDPSGRMTGMTDPAGNLWSWGFDVLGRQVSAVDPDTGTTTTAYDDAGRAVSTTDARGVTLASTYDALDRVKVLNEGSATGPLVASWTFDTLSKGLLSSSTSYVGSVPGTPGKAYTQAITGYDAADRPTGSSTTLPVGTAMAGTYTTSLRYAQDGSLGTLTSPAMGGLGAETLRYSYDDLGKLTGFSGLIAGAVQTYAGGLAYTYLGNIARYSQPRGSLTFYRVFGYEDGTNRLTRIQGILGSATANVDVSDRQYTYDHAGNITSLSTAADGIDTDTQCFSYDPLRVLTEAWTPGDGDCSAAPSAAALGGPAPYWTSWSVDPATGNRTQVVEHSATGGPDTTSSHAYPAAGQPHPHAVQTVTHTTDGQTTTDDYGTPDAAGNTVTRPGQELGYDLRGKLASLRTADGDEQTSVYDASGNLLVRSDPESGTTAYLGNTQLHVAPGSSTVTAVRTYTLNGSPVAERTTTEGVTGTALYWLDPDPLGTAAGEVLSTDGTITRRYQDPYGNPRGDAVDWSSDHGYLNAPTSDFSGLTQLGARLYDPALGRFITPDPLMDPADHQQINGYSYANNSPIANSDPTGLLCTNGPDGMCRRPGSLQPDATPGVSDRQSPTLRKNGMTVSPHDVVLTFSNPKFDISRCEYSGGDYCIQEKSMTLFEVMYPAPVEKPNNYCGSWSWLCTLVGYNQARNCFDNPSVEQCVGAVLAVATDIFVVGKAVKGAELLAATAARTASGSSERLLWTSWQNYPKANIGDHQYAMIGDRLYTRHAVDRMQPSDLGAPAGTIGAGRSVSPNFVEDVLTTARGVPTKGPAGQARLSFTSGNLEVITEDGIVVTVMVK
jgi:RHS repeat-associated protein